MGLVIRVPKPDAVHIGPFLSLGDALLFWDSVRFKENQVNIFMLSLLYLRLNICIENILLASVMYVLIYLIFVYLQKCIH